MKKRNIKLSIPEPCSQSWDEMTPVNGGKHCEHCNKYVTDFTGMSDEEIFRVIKNSKGNICSRITNSQLERPITSYESSSFDLLKVAAMAAGITLLSVQSNAQLNHKRITELTTSENYYDNGDLLESVPTFPNDSIVFVKGKITDKQTGEVMPYAVIALLNNKQVMAVANTNEKGEYEIKLPCLQEGNYSVKCTYAGYKLQEVLLGDSLQSGYYLDFCLDKDLTVIKAKQEMGYTMGCIVMPESVNEKSFDFERILKDYPPTDPDRNINLRPPQYPRH